MPIREIISTEVADGLEYYFLTAERGFADEATLGLRRMKAGAKLRASGQWSIVKQQRLGDRWIPLPKEPPARRGMERSPDALAVLSERSQPSGVFTVSQLFKVSLGARVGGKSALMLTADAFHRLSDAEKKLFLPAADDIAGGSIWAVKNLAFFT